MGWKRGAPAELKKSIILTVPLLENFGELEGLAESKVTREDFGELEGLNLQVFKPSGFTTKVALATAMAESFGIPNVHSQPEAAIVNFLASFDLMPREPALFVFFFSPS